jgi:hypothetical protein
MIHEPKGFEHANLPSGRHINLLWAYPITRHELHFSVHSEDPLELECRLLEEAETVISPDRKCLIQPENRAQRRARLKIQPQAKRRTPRQRWVVAASLIRGYDLDLSLNASCLALPETRPGNSFGPARAAGRRYLSVIKGGDGIPEVDGYAVGQTRHDLQHPLLAPGVRGA